MRATLEVTLGGVRYVVPKLNVGQIEEITERGRTGRPFDVLRLAFARVEPKVDVNTIEADADEIGAAIRAIMAFSGFNRPDEKN